MRDVFQSCEEENQLSSMNSLPKEIIMDCVARVPRSYYPILSLVSNHLQSLVTSHELYETRSIRGCEEYCIYVAISKNQTSNIHWYTLSRKPNNKFWLVPISSLPPMPLHGSYEVVGSSIYVMGGFHKWGLITSNVSRIDCLSHTVQNLTEMPKAVAGSVSKLIDGKMYVIGGSKESDIPSEEELKFLSAKMMVFDIESQTWEFVMKSDWFRQKWLSSVEMAGKIYMRSYDNSYVCEPKKGRYVIDTILHSKEWSNACAIDNVLYYYDVRRNRLRTFDPQKRAWGRVKGVKLGRLEEGSWACTTSYGGKLAVFLQKVVALSETTEIWCAEISVEKRKDGKIWGKVEWYDLVLDGKSCIMKCLAVKIDV